MTFKQMLLLAGLPLAGLATRPAAAQAPAAPASTPHEHGHDAVAGGERTTARPGASVYIIAPRDGAVLRSTRVKVVFGARDVGVAPAGVNIPNTGHHHILVDSPLPEDMSAPIPADRNHLHYGAGQTETVLDLAPGTHTLQLLMGDANHVPHDPPLMSQKITIQVRPGALPQRLVAR